MEFTYSNYISILERILVKGYTCSTFEEYHESYQLYLRHDVDIFLEGILPMAEIESKLGLKSIWFFQPNTDFYNLLSAETLGVIKKLNTKGHQIGLHVDAYVEETKTELIDYIERLYNFYSKRIPLTRVISFHRPPKFIRENFEVPGFINVYGEKYFKKILYFSDSGRREFEFSLFEALERENGKSVQLLTHPYWWGKTSMDLGGTWERFLDTKKVRFANILRRYFRPYKDFDFGEETS